MRILTWIVLTLICQCSIAQSPYVLPSSRGAYIADRAYVLGLDRNRFSSIGNVERAYLASIASEQQNSDIWYLYNDNSDYLSSTQHNGEDQRISEKVYSDSSFYYYTESSTKQIKPFEIEKGPNWLGLYKTKANFYEIDQPSFSLRVNPLLHISYGKDSEADDPIIQNTRGVELRGRIDDKVYFYTSLTDNQRSFMSYTDADIRRYNRIPGHGFYKFFQSSVIDQFKGYDYFDARGYVGLNVTKHIAAELGHGKHFIGNGMRSLLLSDFADDYFYVKLNTRIWKLQYQNIFAELNALNNRDITDQLIVKKYMASHYLTFKPTDRFEIGLFESVIFGRERYELQYLNPIILYRVIESGLGSFDNVLIGLNANYLPVNQIQVYSQLILDEFKLSELRANSGWWANKYGIQIGLKYYDALGVDHLDLQIEYNRVRPYTYSHDRSISVISNYAITSYTHGNNPLTHPLGANFKELLLDLRYQWQDKIFVNARVISTEYGETDDQTNVGKNILLLNSSRDKDFGNEIAQGYLTEVRTLQLNLSYQWMHNFYFDLDLVYRNANSTLPLKDLQNRYVSVGLRINLDRHTLDY